MIGYNGVQKAAGLCEAVRGLQGIAGDRYVVLYECGVQACLNLIRHSIERQWSCSMSGDDGT